MHENPKLIPLEAFRIVDNNVEKIGIRDPASLNDEAYFVVSPELFALLTYFDGLKSIDEIQEAFQTQSGYFIEREQIEQVISMMDEQLLLDSERYQAHRVEQLKQYQASDFRAAYHAGKSYPDDPGELSHFIEGFFANSHSSTSAHFGAVFEAAATVKNGEPMQLPKAIIAPHIDFNRGGRMYAKAYLPWQTISFEDAPLCVILGIDHKISKSFFSVTDKPYSTPFGMVKQERNFIARLQKMTSFDIFTDELNHVTEHSIEFQVLMMQWLSTAKGPFHIVPILCGSFQPFIEAQSDPLSHPDVRSFIQSLKELIAGYSKTVYLISGVDFSHVGVQFQQPAPTATEIEQTVAFDKKLLKAIEAGDADAFFSLIVNNRNATNVCGVTAIYTLLKVMEECRGCTTGYDYWHDESLGSMVSFASVNFY